jgi:hypothetical protein
LAGAGRADWTSRLQRHAQATSRGLVLLAGVGGDELLDRNAASQSRGNIAFVLSVSGGVGMRGMGVSGMGMSRMGMGGMGVSGMRLGRAKRQSMEWSRSSRLNVSEGDTTRVHRGSRVRGAAESHSRRGTLKMRRGLVPVVHVRKAVEHPGALIPGHG